MFPVKAFSHLVNGILAARRDRRTARIMADLPAEIRKDIGWPGFNR